MSGKLGKPIFKSQWGNVHTHSSLYYCGAPGRATGLKIILGNIHEVMLRRTKLFF
jgi:hypothetical protein